MSTTPFSSTNGFSTTGNVAGNTFITGNIIPSTDNVYFLGNSTNRWANLWLGPGTIYITDAGNVANVAQLTVENGILQVNGATGLQANLVAGNTTLTMNTSGPVVISPSGVANVLTINNQGANITGNLTVTGNITSAVTYGSFYDTTTQTNSNVGNAIPVSYNSVDINNGIVLAGSNTQITIQKTGIYNIQFSLQLSKSDAGTDNVYIWLRKNGTDVPESAGDITLAGNGAKTIAAWNYVVSATAGDYYQLMWMSTDANASIVRLTDGVVVPNIPSVILTVVPVGA